MPKLPWIKFWPDDWRRDLRRFNKDVRVVWLECLIEIWQHGENGTYAGDLKDLSRSCGLDVRYLRRVLKKISATDLGEVELREDDSFLLCSRRIARDIHERELSRKTTREWRQRCDTSHTLSRDVSRDTPCDGEKLEARVNTLSKPKKRSGSKYSEEEKKNREAFEEYFDDAHVREWNSRYIFDYGKDRAIMYRIVKKFPLLDLAAMVDLLVQWVKDPQEKWITEYSLEVFEKKQRRLFQTVQKIRQKREELYAD